MTITTKVPLGVDNQTFLISVSSSFSDDSLQRKMQPPEVTTFPFFEDNDTAGVVIVNTDNHSKEDGSESGSLTVRLQSRRLTTSPSI